MPAILIQGTIDLSFYITFTDLDIVWLSQGQRYAKFFCFIFYQNVQLIRM